MKKIYHFYHEIACCRIFIDEDAQFVCQTWGYPEDASDVDFESIQKAFQHVGSDLIELNGADCFPDDRENDLEENISYDDFELKEWVERKPIQSMLKEAIRSIEAEISAPADRAEEEDFVQAEVVNHVGPLLRKIEEENVSEKEKKVNAKKKTSSKKSTAFKKTAKPKAKKPTKKPATKPSKKPAKGGSKKK